MARRSAERRSPGRFTRYWLPVLLYVTVIFLVSAQPRLHAPIAIPHIDKVAHTIEYMILGMLLARAIGGMLKSPSFGVVALVAICCGIIVGTSDELFQSKIPGRESDPVDLMADTFGLTLGQFVLRAIRRS